MKILDVSPIGVYPLTGGGQKRIHNINIEISKYHQIFLFSQGIRYFELKFPLKSWITRINHNYMEYRFTSYLDISLKFILSLISRYFSVIYSDKILKLYDPKILKNKTIECDIIKVEYPWQFSYIFDKKPKDTPIILVEHNAEFELYDKLMNHNNLILSKSIKKLLISIAIEKEKFAVENADIIFTVSEMDKNKLIKKYDVKKSKFYVIPNGVDVSRFTVPTLTEKNRYKRQIIGDPNKKVILFVGSLYYPNIEAVKFIIHKIAPEVFKHHKNSLFLIVGSVGNYFKNISLNKNISITGKVEDIVPYFKIADIAINPIISGSGTNIKLLEYLASGIPTITTPFGIRGIDVESNKHVMVKDIEDFSEGILELLSDEDLQKKLSINGRKLVEEKYDWKKISKEELKILNQIV